MIKKFSTKRNSAENCKNVKSVFVEQIFGFSDKLPLKVN